MSRATGRAFEQGDLTSWASRDVAPSLKRIVQSVVHFRTRRSRYVKGSGWKRLVSDLNDGSLKLKTPSATFDTWQRQGVLFLNTGLTLTRYQQGGHPHQKDGHIPLWAPVVGAICMRLAEREAAPVVFLSWGAFARRFLYRLGVLTDSTRTAQVVPRLANAGVVIRDHPATHRFLDTPNLFREVNQNLRALGAEPIDW
ncbi:hypothetical protein ACFL4G_06770 [Thermodesulfobacteriota bacterium]